MSNSPIQIVLNTDNFIEELDRQPGGTNKDFFAGRDREFELHRHQINVQLENIENIRKENPYSKLAYAKLILRPSALAKSHRPTKRLFTPDKAPVIGAGDLGELFVEIRPQSVEWVKTQAGKAHSETRWKEKDDNRFASPSKYRSEVGAIDKVVPYGPSDKRNFSLEEGLDWLSNPQTRGAYIVQLFQDLPPRHEWDRYHSEKFKLFKSFVDGLLEFGGGLEAVRLTDASIFGVRLSESEVPASVRLMPSRSSMKNEDASRVVNLDRERHGELLGFFDAHQLVKKVNLPPIIKRSSPEIGSGIAPKFELPSPVENGSYPKIGIVDGGVSSVIGDWLEESWDFLAEDDRDETHGTFIAGLTIAGSSINAHELFTELDGCKVIDLDIFPKNGAFHKYYPSNVLQLFEELKYPVQELKEQTGVRIFNFSLNLEEHVSTDSYSLSAQILDRIAIENDVMFIISAGNTKPQDMRGEWPDDPIKALSILATTTNDRIKRPAESCRNLSVAAVNPPGVSNVIEYAPSRYSCRGPGLKVGLKPDLAHIGGSGTKYGSNGSGLNSLNEKGDLVDDYGTSFAVPHVAKTLASLDHKIAGDVSRETLIALTVHHAEVPKVLEDKRLKAVSKQMVGFGVPRSSEEILEGADHAITLVFANRVYPGQRMRFNFTWPDCLVRDEKCFGHAKLTVVSTPPFDYRFGSEFVRININGYLRHEKNDGRYKGELRPIFLPEKISGMQYEHDLIKHALKWSPIKVYERRIKKGISGSTSWRLDVEYLARDEEELPLYGVPFTALLTLSDPDGEKPVFNDMRQIITALGAEIRDIKTAVRIEPRV